MGKVRLVYRGDGGVAVIYPAPKSKREGETESQWLKRVFTKAMQEDDTLYGCDYEDVNSSSLPQSRRYREAWVRKPGGGIQVDPAKKAKVDNNEIPKGGLRTEEEQQYEDEIRSEMRTMAKERLDARRTP